MSDDDTGLEDYAVVIYVRHKVTGSIARLNGRLVQAECLDDDADDHTPAVPWRLTIDTSGHLKFVRHSSEV